jgi:hypothetical protein
LPAAHGGTLAGDAKRYNELVEDLVVALLELLLWLVDKMKKVNGLSGGVVVRDPMIGSSETRRKRSGGYKVGGVDNTPQLQHTLFTSTFTRTATGEYTLMRCV